MEEIVALFSICLLTGVGWVAAKLCFSRVVSDENCIYFAPALGAGICGVVAYLAIHSYQPKLIGAFCVAVAIVAAVFWKRLRFTLSCSSSPAGRSSDALIATERHSHASHRDAATGNEPWRLFRFTALTFLAVYGMQITLYGLFSRLYPGPQEPWTLFNMTGTPPSDQMFAWHQAMYADQHRQYPADPFLADMDLYDRPQLGGYITLFFFRLFGLPLTEDQFVYPPDGLHFYHCLWWLLNNLYLVGVAPLFRKLFGYRGAIIAVATTALGGFFFICSAGSWMKFAGTYPFLLAFLLYLENRGPVLQGLLCAVSYYIHGSVLPFLAGFGLLQIFNLRYPFSGRRLPARDVGLFAAVGVVLVGAWFVVVRVVGSKQPLLYYYIYGAGLTEAQTKPVADLAKAFYERHTWGSLSFFPVHSLLYSWLPVGLWKAAKAWTTLASPISLAGLANAFFDAQRFCFACALAVVAAPMAIAGSFKALVKQHAGKVALCLYLVPTLMVALLYRIEWAFSLHVLVLYHSLVLFLWVTALERKSPRFVVLWVGLVALEGLVCVVFADVRLLPAKGLRLTEIPGQHWGYLIAFVAFWSSILGAAAWEMKRAGAPAAATDSSAPVSQLVRVSGLKLLAGLAMVAFVIGIYSIYCLRFYPR